MPIPMDPDSTWPGASVLIPVLDEARHLEATMERARAQDYPGPLELLVIDGGSTDGSREMLERLALQDPRIRLLDNPRGRTPHALNVGLHAATGEVIVRMDAHTRYPADYISHGVARLRQGDATHVSGPALAVGGGTGGWSGRIALALRTPLGVGGARFRRSGTEEFEVDTGFAGVWWRSVLLEAGGWDERWLTDQDCELAFRLSRNGARHVCLPQMAAEYVPRDSLGSLWRQYWQYGLHKVMTFRRHPESMRRSHVLPPAIAATAVAAVASPRPVRRLARAGLGTYLLATGAGAAAAARRAPLRDAASLPLVYATMHFAYGFGIWAGVGRYGPPLQALARLARHR